ncbi:hypothetical protein ACH5RR_026831 [Cinchona calisaya]|uniref:VQ domain-containing protein n=1 Tax=Cinchona calisaya TaxID=153742 RepID=A0ABD2Z4V3_9GENT
MDSGNSGSMQSSSGGGDEEYDDHSHSESISSFLNTSAHFGSISDPPQPQPQPSSLITPRFSFINDPHSQNNNLDAFPQSVPHHDLIWSRGSIRSELSNYAKFGNVTTASSSSSQSVDLVGAGVQGLHSQPPSVLPSQGSTEATTTANAAAKTASVLPSADHHQPINVVKNPKKRTRASRRAPTTVLTTDTANFRQMVQEFTGIPTPPFSASAASSPYSRRFDLFSSTGHSLGPLHPLRPSAQRVVDQLSSPFGLSSSTTNTANSSIVLPSHNLGGLPKQPQNLLNMQNQMLSFTPLWLNKHHDNYQNNVNADLISGWKDGGGLLNGGVGQENLGGSSSHEHNSSNYYYKFNNCGASTSSEFHHDKGLENVTSGGEGTVGSWICPSD